MEANELKEALASATPQERENLYKEAIASVMKDRGRREELSQLVVEFVQPNHITTDFVGMLLNSRSMNEGDALVRKVRKGIYVRTWVPGSMSLKSELTVSDRMNYALDSSIVSVQANAWELESGELGTVDSIRSEAMAKLKDSFQGKVFKALSTIWNATNTPDNYVDAGGSVTAAALEDMINQVDKVAGRAKAIVGVKHILNPITKFGAFYTDGTTVGVSQTRLDQVLNTGRLGNYMGVPIVAIDQIYDNPEDYNAMLPEDKILVIGENVGEFITYGTERTKEWEDMRPTPPYWNLDIVQRFGLIVDNADGIGVIKVS